MLLQYIFSKVTEKSKDNAFQIIMVICVLVIVGASIYNLMSKENKGTWTTKKYYELIPLTTIESEKGHSRSHRHKQEKGVKNKPGGDSKGEIICRDVLAKIFNDPFDKARPDFLKNPVTGGNYNLELDCFSPRLKIACEYNGRQHYNFIPFFHKNKETFMNQKYRDDMKRRMCKDMNIVLIEVPYTVELRDIESFIITELKKNNLF